jgi:hypothetical protein
MTLVRGQIIFELMNKNKPISPLSCLQIVKAGKMKKWTNKEVFFRNPPFTAKRCKFPYKTEPSKRRTYHTAEEIYRMAAERGIEIGKGKKVVNNLK